MGDTGCSYLDVSFNRSRRSYWECPAIFTPTGVDQSGGLTSRITFRSSKYFPPGTQVTVLASNADGSTAVPADPAVRARIDDDEAQPRNKKIQTAPGLAFVGLSAWFLVSLRWGIRAPGAPETRVT